MARTNGTPAQSEDDPADESDVDAPHARFADAAHYARQVKAYALYYLSARLDTAKVEIRRAIILAILLVVTAVIAITMIVTAAVLFMIGLSDLVNWVFHFAGGGLSPWIGPLIVGGGLLGLILLGVLIIVPRQYQAWSVQTKEKYAEKRRQQREQVTQDIRQRSKWDGSGE